jgi:phosphopantothenoylcysteine decarboxylase / phosphopantothenate---cysteine ligase
MASITIRQLDEEVKRRLRLRAAFNGRSMEDEVRSILRSASSATTVEADAAPSRAPSSESARVPQQALQRPSQAPNGVAQGRPRVLLVIGGGIAAYKSLDLIRRLKERDIAVRCILTAAAREFITPLSAGALSGERVYTDLFAVADELDIGHIRLARDADLVVVAPATADLMARMAQGRADDLASAVMLATERPVLIAPAMNPHMWAHRATQRNLAALLADGVLVVGPKPGEMAEAGEAGLGRMAEPLEIVAAALPFVASGRREKRLTGRRILVTSGPTHEPLDPVRYIANRSSGKQGHAIAGAAAALGAEVILVSGPVNIPDPVGIKVAKVETAQEMLDEVTRALPADAAVFAAAVADWRVKRPDANKIKKEPGGSPHLDLVENPDILATVSRMRGGRPRLVIGFAAETERIIEHAQVKLARKACDWLVANDVSANSGVMGGDRNAVHLVTANAVESWSPRSKLEVARTLVERIADVLAGTPA